MRAPCISRPTRRRIAALGLAAVAALAVAACGGSGHRAPADGHATAGVLLAKTFRATSAIQSGRVDLALDVTLDGVSQLGGKPLTLDVSGPFSRSGGQLSADLTVALDAGATSGSVELVYTGGVLDVNVGGRWYELPRGLLHRHGAGLGGATGASGAAGIFSALGIDPHSWLTNPHDAGTATIGGVDTERFTAGVDAQKMFADLGGVIAARLGGMPAFGGATGLSGAKVATDLQLLASVITSAQLDIYTGRSDQIVRRVHVAIGLRVPSALAAQANGLTGGSLDFTATLTDLNAPQSITAPAGATPLPAWIGALAGQHAIGSLNLG